MDDSRAICSGTIHAGVATSELPAIVTEQIRNTDRFIMETSPGDQFQPISSARGSAAMPMDLELANYAYDSGRTINTLESIAFQRSLLEEVGSAEELAAMMAEDSDGLASLVEAYRSGDVDRISAETQGDDPEFRRRLLTDRNHRWVRKLGRILTHGSAFIAVGVGHCPGPDGLLDLLDRHGYSISRVV